jgi:hypothetical protein
LGKTEVACRKIRSASTETQVIAAVQEYLVSLGPPEVAGIPLHALSSSLVQTEESIHSAIQTLEDALAAIQGGTSSRDAAEGTKRVLTTAARRLAALNGKTS